MSIFLGSVSSSGVAEVKGNTERFDGKVSAYPETMEFEIFLSLNR